MQSAGQLIPGPETLPPADATTVRLALPGGAAGGGGGAGLKRAVTTRSAPITTVQVVATPLHDSPQASSSCPGPGVAVSCTTWGPVRVLGKGALQVGSQAMPLGALVTVPAPATRTVSVGPPVCAGTPWADRNRTRPAEAAAGTSRRRRDRIES
jgi:hypothetical protein